MPADDRCALVFDFLNKAIFFGKVAFLNWATFGFPSRNLSLSLLSMFPIIGNILAMNTYFSPELDEDSPDSTEEELSYTDVKGIDIKKKNCSYLITKFVRRIEYVIRQMVLYIVEFNWTYIINIIIEVGSICTLTYCLWYLSEDRNIFTITFIDKILPRLIIKAKERLLLTDNTSHLISEISFLTTSSVYYHLFREQIFLNVAVDPLKMSHTPFKTLMYKEEEYPKIFGGSAAISTASAALTLGVQRLLRGND